MTLFDLAYAVGIAFTAPIWLTVPKWRRKVLDALRDRRGVVPKADVTRLGVMIHAVSMGEVNATTALVRLLLENYPKLRIIISTTSRTGFNRARELYEKNPDITRVRFPFDFTRSHRRLLESQRPKVVVLMELEVWPNFMIECQKRDVAVVLVNGRISDVSYRNYRWVKAFIRPMFSRLALACAQDEAYRQRFESLGVSPDHVRVTGTMKFDTATVGTGLLPGADEIAEHVGLDLKSHKVWVCGSTGPGEEQLVLEAFKLLRPRYPQLRLAIIPRHPERFNEVAKLIEQAGLPCVRRSTWEKYGTLSHMETPNPNSVVLGDTMGELRKFYSLADVVFVGRTLVDLGSKQHGSDMIEPAALGKPVIVGPFTGNFIEAMKRFREAKAIREVANATQLQDAVSDYLMAPIAAKEMGSRAQQVVRSNQGATLRHVQAILSYLPKPPAEPNQELEETAGDEDDIALD